MLFIWDLLCCEVEENFDAAVNGTRDPTLRNFKICPTDSNVQGIIYREIKFTNMFIYTHLHLA